MTRHVFFLLSFIFIITVSAVATGTPTPTPDPAYNLVVNGDFSLSTIGWNFVAAEGGVGTFTADDNEAQINVKYEGNEIWAILLYQQALLFENGQNYLVSFDAKADNARKITVLAGMSNDPWLIYSNYEVLDITEEMQTYSFIFTMNEPTDINGQLEFNLGKYAGNITLDNIAIYKTHIAPTPTPVEVNVAAGKTVKASSYYSPVYGPINAFDDDVNTLWASKPDMDYAWIYVDLGQETEIVSVMLHWFEDFYALKYSLGATNDQDNWQIIYEENDCNGGVEEIRGKITTRYIGILCRKRNIGKIAYALKEFEVYSLEK